MRNDCIARRPHGNPLFAVQLQQLLMRRQQKETNLAAAPQRSPLCAGQ
jgi:hypothetical protein